MFNYDYNEALKSDSRDYIKEEIDLNEWEADQLYDELNDRLWCVDSVTGNASGSYTFNSYKAREYVLDNMDILEWALNDFGADNDTIAENFIKGNWEYFDVTIRCHLLCGALSEVIEELVDEGLLVGKGW